MEKSQSPAGVPTTLDDVDSVEFLRRAVHISPTDAEQIRKDAAGAMKRDEK